jgi:hypothetical protein
MEETGPTPPVLFAQDKLAVCRLPSGKLHQIGYEHRTAPSGQEAFEWGQLEKSLQLQSSMGVGSCSFSDRAYVAEQMRAEGVEWRSQSVCRAGEAGWKP